MMAAGYPQVSMALILISIKSWDGNMWQEAEWGSHACRLRTRKHTPHLIEQIRHLLLQSVLKVTEFYPPVFFGGFLWSVLRAESWDRRIDQKSIDTSDTKSCFECQYYINIIDQKMEPSHGRWHPAHMDIPLLQDLLLNEWMNNNEHLFIYH